jgi:hypothetical protein
VKGPLLFSTLCGSWVGLTGLTYDALPLDEFLFDFDANGTVVSVTNLALRSTLYKVDLGKTVRQLTTLCDGVCKKLV